MGNRMAPSPRPLPDDLIPDILLRLPPDDPAGIVRASAVCKAWRRIITDPAFPGRYRASHPTAPVLGFLHRPSDDDDGEEGRPRFVSTTSFRAAAADHRQLPLDCRHGRAVFYDYGSPNDHGSYVVWDPTTGERHRLPEVPGNAHFSHAAVVCAADGVCDHRGCSGGPFIVAFLRVEYILHADEDWDEDVHVYASLYASDTGEFTVSFSIHLRRYDLDPDRPAALVGDSLYFLCSPGILRYRYGYGLLRRLGGNVGIRSGDVVLSMMELPRGERFGMGNGNGKNTQVVLMKAEGGGLGLACLTGTKLYLSVMETEGTAPGDDGRWVQRRVIDLKTMLPVGNNPEWKPCFRGVAQDANVIFVSTEDGVFSVDHSELTLQVRKVCELGVVGRWIYPFVSFYTESLLRKLASGKLLAPVGNQ